MMTTPRARVSKRGGSWTFDCLYCRSTTWFIGDPWRVALAMARAHIGWHDELIRLGVDPIGPNLT